MKRYLTSDVRYQLVQWKKRLITFVMLVTSTNWNSGKKVKARMLSVEERLAIERLRKSIVQMEYLILHRPRTSLTLPG